MTLGSCQPNLPLTGIYAEKITAKYENFPFGNDSAISSTKYYFNKFQTGEQEMITKSNDTIRLFTDNNGISHCDSSFGNCNLIYSFNDTNIIYNKSPVTFNIWPFYENDVKLVDSIEMEVGGGRYKVYKFIEDKYHSSHSVYYSYYVKEFGFIAFINYFGETYQILSELKNSRNIQNDEAHVHNLISKLVKDSSFFEYPQYIEPPNRLEK